MYRLQFFMDNKWISTVVACLEIVWISCISIECYSNQKSILCIIPFVFFFNFFYLIFDDNLPYTIHLYLYFKSIHLYLLCVMCDSVHNTIISNSLWKKLSLIVLRIRLKMSITQNPVRNVQYIVYSLLSLTVYYNCSYITPTKPNLT
jgi:hypothetical protein